MAAPRHGLDASQHAPAGKQLATEVNSVFRLVPTVTTAPAMTTAISDAISAYSIAVTADSSAQKEIARCCRRFIFGCLLCTAIGTAHRFKWGARGHGRPRPRDSATTTRHRRVGAITDKLLQNSTDRYRPW